MRMTNPEEAIRRNATAWRRSSADPLRRPHAGVRMGTCLPSVPEHRAHHAEREKALSAAAAACDEATDWLHEDVLGERCTSL